MKKNAVPNNTNFVKKKFFFLFFCLLLMNFSYGQTCGNICQNTTNPVTHCDPSNVAQFSTSIDSCTIQLCPTTIYASHSWSVYSFAPVFTWNSGDTCPVLTVPFDADFTISHTVYLPGGGGDFCTEIVSVNSCLVCDSQADFTYTDSGCIVDFTAPNAGSYYWDFGDGNTSTLQNPTHKYNFGQWFTVVLTVNNGGTSYSCTKNINISCQNACYGEPPAGVSMTVTPVNCSTFVFAPPPVSNCNNPTYLWDFGDGNTSTASNPQHSYANTGNFDVRIDILCDNGNGWYCVDDIDIDPSCFSSLCDSVSHIVSGCNVDFSAPNATFYQWDFGDGNISYQQFPIHSYADQGPFNVWLQIEEAGNLEDCFFDVFPDCFAACNNGHEIGVTMQNCSTYTFTVPPVCNDVSYYWDFGDGNTSTAAQPQHTYAAAGTFNVTVNFVCDNGDEYYCDKDIIVDFQNCNFCDSTTYVVSGCSVNFGAPSGDSYLWDFGDGNTSTLQNPTHKYTTQGSYTVNLSIWMSGTVINCTLNNVTPDCFDACISNQLGVTMQNCSTFVFAPPPVSNCNNPTYLWDFGDGNTSTASNPQHTYANGGTYTARVNILCDSGDEYYCEESVNSTCFVCTYGNEIGVSMQNCSTYVFSPHYTYNCNNPTYNWDFGDGNTSTASHPQHTYTNGGTYNVNVNILCDNGDQHLCDKDILVDLSCTFCDSTSYTVSGCSVSFSTPTADSYLWIFGDGNTSTDQNPTHTYSTQGNYNVSLTLWVGNESFNCYMTVTPNCYDACIVNEIGVAPQSCNTFMFTPPPVSNCNSPVYSWDFGDGNTSTASNSQHTYSSSGNYNVTVNIVCDNGYEYYCDKDVLVENCFTCDSVSYTVNGCTVLFGAPGADSYLWDFGDGNTSTLQYPIHKYDLEGTYTVNLTLWINGQEYNCTLEVTPDCYNACFVESEGGVIVEGCGIYTFTPPVIPECNNPTYLWDFGDGNTSTLSNPTHSYTASGVYIVRVEIKCDNGDEYYCEPVNPSNPSY